MNAPINLAIFASGSGTNAENIIQYFQDHSAIKVVKVLSNKTHAYVLTRAEKLNVPTQAFTKNEFQDERFLRVLGNVDYIVLAGFLWLIPKYLIQAFPDRIVNIHPALLPKFGGKGMYGEHVHAAVLASDEKESGITIHLVNEAYDDGATLFQAKCVVEEGETPSSLAKKVHKLEYSHFPRVIERYIQSSGQ